MIYVNINFITVVLSLFLFILGIVIFKKLGVNKISLLRFSLIVMIILLTLKLQYKTATSESVLKVNVLIDNSYSMKYNYRIDKIKEWLQKYYNLISKKYITKLYVFNDDINEITDLSKIEPVKRGTRIERSVDNLLYKLKDRNLIILFTDGNNLTDELPKLKPEKVFLVPVTFDERNFRDISILDVRYSNVGFKDVEHKINIEVISDGYDNRTIISKLIDLENKQIIDRKQITLTKNVKFEHSFIPSRVGKYKLRIELENLPGEVTYENNFREISINVKKNKIRILYICGQPSPEYFHLRNLIKNDPSIELVSFVILRNPDSVVIVPDEDLALIPFPVYDIFVKELFNYDLVIFENFTYRGFWITNEYLDNIRKFVISGGGFIMIAGNNSFFLGGYKYTPIEEVLPVVINEKEQLVYVEYKPEVVDYNNSIIKIYDETTENKYVWRNIPHLANYQKVAGVKPQATVILSYGDNPIMCYWNVGKGRVFVSMTNTTWRWVLGKLISDKYDYKYLHNKLWKNIIYYTAGAEDMKPIYIICNDRFNLNEQISIKLLTNITLNQIPQINVIYPDKRKKMLYVKKISDSVYVSDFIPELEGKYTLLATANHAGNFFSDQKDVNVGWYSYNEIARLNINFEYLKNLSALYDTEIKFIDNLDFDKIVNEFNSKFKVEFTTVFDFNNWFPAGFIFTILFLLEIFFTRFK